MQHCVDITNAGRRLDAVVRLLRADLPLSVVMKWTRTGLVRLNGRKAKPATRLEEGDVIMLPPPPALTAAPATSRRPAPRLPPLDILHEDSSLLVVSKPAGVACHGGTGNEQDSLAARVVQYLGAEKAPPGHRPGLAQRLDKGVSGVLAVGKHAAALRVLSAQVLAGEVDKVYTALVHGKLRRSRGVIDVPLRVDDQPMGNRPRTFPDPEGGKAARTEYEVVDRFATGTLVQVRIHTGRTHQIRAHMLSMGHPLLGDPRYGVEEANAYLMQTYGLRRPFLHAGTLAFSHPDSGELLQFTAPLPADLVRVVKGMQSRSRASV